MAVRRKEARYHQWLLVAAAVVLLVLLLEPLVARLLRPAIPGVPELPGLVGVGAAQTEPDPDALWALGRQLAHRGDYGHAADVYATLAQRLPPDSAPRALVSRAEVALQAGNPAVAEEATRQVLAAYGASDQALPALFLQARARMDAGDYTGALEAFDTYQERGGGAVLGPYLWLQRAECYAQLGDFNRQIQAARRALETDGGGPRLARIDALERAADAAQKLGSDADALDYDARILDLAATRAYRAGVVFKMAGLAQRLGQTETALDRFRSLVVDFPEQPVAVKSLDALNQLGRSDSVTFFQAGVVRLNARDYRSALALLAQVPGDDPNAGTAAFDYGVALVRLGREQEAIQHFEWVAQGYPKLASTALLRAARVLEADGRFAEAATAYAQVDEAAPGSADADAALFRLGLTRYLLGELGDAVRAWQRLADPSRNAAPAQRAAALYWQGKATARVDGAGSATARDAWSAAVSAGPSTYYAFRAQDALGGVVSPESRPVERTPAALGRVAQDQDELAAWLAARGTSPQALADKLSANPALARADALLAVGLRAEAEWEVELVVQQAADARDPARLAALGDWLAQRDLAQAALRAGLQARSLTGQPLEALPRALQKQVYPTGWGDVAAEQAAQRGVDPLLLLALVRQESSFDPRAQSGAGALGLAQVMPSTAAGIARALGTPPGFQTRDLFKPAVSLDFGAYFLADQLRQYDGRIFPALAAYNAGGGNSDRWLDAWGADPDVFVEEMPFAETQHYVQVVYENYRNYLRLYGE